MTFTFYFLLYSALLIRGLRDCHSERSAAESRNLFLIDPSASLGVTSYHKTAIHPYNCRKTLFSKAFGSEDFIFELLAQILVFDQEFFGVLSALSESHTAVV